MAMDPISQSQEDFIQVFSLRFNFSLIFMPAFHSHCELLWCPSEGRLEFRYRNH